MRSIAIVVLLAGALLAGCSSHPAATPATPGPSFGDLGLQATSSTGVIRGVVVDDAIRPLVNATIGITSLGKQTQSNGQGAFGFDGLAPGTYFLKVHKFGFVDAQQSVDVVAGVSEPNAAKIQLVADLSQRAFVETYVYDGFVECTSSAVVLCGAANLVTSQNITNDRFTWDQYLSDGASMVQSELVWQSTQAVSPQLYFEMEAIDGGCSPSDDGFMNSTRGESPIYTQLNSSVIEKYGIGTKCPIYYSIFSGGPVCTDPTPVPQVGTLNPICPGVTFEQRFTMYIHAFYGFLPPADWRFSSGDPVPMPPA
jgi:hypothetical protein